MVPTVKSGNNTPLSLHQDSLRDVDDSPIASTNEFLYLWRATPQLRIDLKLENPNLYRRPLKGGI